MKFKYLGTAAAEGWPAMFCDCESCNKAKAAGGKNIRTRSQAIIDGKLLIDFPADTYMHVLYQGLNLSEISSCIITHSHSDHLYAADFEMRRKGFAHLPSEKPLTVYGTEATGIKTEKIIDKYLLNKENRVLFSYVTPFIPFNIDEYTITPLKADHDPMTNPVFYIINDGISIILYANDTGYFPDETWRYLEEHKLKFDFISFDCTFGNGMCRHGHMGIDTNVEVRNRLFEIDCADNKTKFCINHFSHNGIAIYDELVPIAKKFGFLVSYDGMEIEV